MKYARIVFVAITASVVLGLGIWCFLGWMVNRAFKSGVQGGSFQSLPSLSEYGWNDEVPRTNFCCATRDDDFRDCWFVS